MKDAIESFDEVVFLAGDYSGGHHAAERVRSAAYIETNRHFWLIGCWLNNWVSVAGSCFKTRLGLDVARENGSHGLVSMSDRACAFGGESILNSQPGHGTTIQLEVRLDQQPHSFG